MRRKVKGGNKNKVKDIFADVNRSMAIFICPQCTHDNHHLCGNGANRTRQICECPSDSHKEH